MPQLERCPDCPGLRPAGAACPHCEARPGPLGHALRVAGGGLALLTLSACYGPAARYNVQPPPPDQPVQAQPDAGANEKGR